MKEPFSVSDFNYARALAEAMVEYGGALGPEQSMVLARAFLERNASALKLIRDIDDFHELCAFSLSLLRPMQEAWRTANYLARKHWRLAYAWYEKWQG